MPLALRTSTQTESHDAYNSGLQSAQLEMTANYRSKAGAPMLAWAVCSEEVGLDKDVGRFILREDLVPARQWGSTFQDLSGLDPMMQELNLVMFIRQWVVDHRSRVPLSDRHFFILSDIERVILERAGLLPHLTLPESNVPLGGFASSRRQLFPRGTIARIIAQQTGSPFGDDASRMRQAASIRFAVDRIHAFGSRTTSAAVVSAGGSSDTGSAFGGADTSLLPSDASTDLLAGVSAESRMRAAAVIRAAMARGEPGVEDLRAAMRTMSEPERQIMRQVLTSFGQGSPEQLNQLFS